MQKMPNTFDDVPETIVSSIDLVRCGDCGVYTRWKLFANRMMVKYSNKCTGYYTLIVYRWCLDASSSSDVRDRLGY